MPVTASWHPSGCRGLLRSKVERNPIAFLALLRKCDVSVVYLVCRFSTEKKAVALLRDWAVVLFHLPTPLAINFKRI
jgi:hypothetical protein